MALALATALAHTSIFVSPTGSDGNSGSIPTSPLASCAAAVRRIEGLLDSARTPPAGGIEVVFAAGTYPLTPATACGTVNVRGTRAAPLVFRAAAGEVAFDGVAALDTAALAPVTNATVRSLLDPAAAASVRALPVPATSGWSDEGQTLQWGARPLTPSVWPNAGLGYVEEIFDAGAIYTPGRTKGPPPVCGICTGDQRSTREHPCGANFSLAVAPTGDWQRELQAGPGFGGKQVVLEGYLGADWFHEAHSIARVVREDGRTTVQLGDSSHYGICESIRGRGPNCTGGDMGGAPGRFHVHGLLSNVDSAGEIFFDAAARILYLIPPDDTRGTLGFWAGPALITVANSTFVTVRDFTVTGSRSTAGTMAIVGGSNNTIGGCTVKSCSSGIFLSGGHRNTVVGNDIYDITGKHIETSSDPDEDLAHSYARLIPTDNLVSNNHLTQVWLATAAWGVHAGGVGDRFVNNLLHDAPGQLILPGGPLTLWDRNEVDQHRRCRPPLAVCASHRAAGLQHGLRRGRRRHVLPSRLPRQGLRHAPSGELSAPQPRRPWPHRPPCHPVRRSLWCSLQLLGQRALQGCRHWHCHVGGRQQRDQQPHHEHRDGDCRQRPGRHDRQVAVV